MNPNRLLRRILAGSLDNVAFGDFTRLVEAFGFRLVRTRGGHRIYGHPDVTEKLNLQDVDGEAKPYQIRQFLELIERHDLRRRNDR